MIAFLAHYTPLQSASIVLCLLTWITLMMRLRQTRLRVGWGLVFRVAMASLALAYVQKTWGRLEGNLASPVDVWREGSLLACIIAKLVIGWREGRN